MFTNRRILIYTISLALTLITICFCILIMLKNKNFERENSFNLGLPSENFYEDFCGCSLEKILSYRKFVTYSLTNSENSDKLIFKQIQSAIRNIIKNDDGDNGIHVKFNKKTSYGDVIRILDICETEKVPTYIVKDYDVWIMTGKNPRLEKDCPFKFPKK